MLNRERQSGDTALLTRDLDRPPSPANPSSNAVTLGVFFAARRRLDGGLILDLGARHGPLVRRVGRRLSPRRNLLAGLPGRRGLRRHALGWGLFHRSLLSTKKLMRPAAGRAPQMGAPG